MPDPMKIQCLEGTITLSRNANGHVEINAEGVLMSPVDVEALKEGLDWYKQPVVKPQRW